VSGADPALVREVLRDVLAELLPELVAEAGGPARRAATMTPPPPIAAVHRPSTFHREETVALGSDAELAAFVQRLLQRAENPAEREAIRSGALRFTLERGRPGAPAPGGARRIDHGAVTERLVREAAASGDSILLGPRAVLTPLARDVARTLGVTIEKEKRC